MLDYLSFIQPPRPIDVCAANLAAIDVALFRANKLAKAQRQLGAAEVTAANRRVAGVKKKRKTGRQKAV